ncbi:HlyD family secretion protein [Collimonas silvisoli]|uniref:HlyD family secretion protein n=1 Tax=Collimonas silvisoli TaxID=2825884 RepID=UPI001B8BD5B1|nr:HlyD family secretion protein [Collimonas silvisoli]
MTNAASEAGAPAMTAKRKKLSGRLRIVTGVAIAVGIGAAAYGWHWWNNGRFMENTDDAYVGGDITVISPKVPGYIVSAAVTDNQVVHAGDLLVKLDDRDYKAALEKAEGAVAAQQALLANLDATRNLQQAVIAQTRAGVAASAAETLRSYEDEQRYQNLSAKAAVSVQSAQRANADYKQALANGQKAQAVQVAAERELEVIATRRQQAVAALAQASAERDIAKLNLGYTELRAPIDGTIGNRYARNGAYAAAGAHMMAIVPARGLWVDANFKESQLAKVRPGLPATVEADVLPGRRFHGHVAGMAPATGAQFSVLPPENATGNFTKIVQRVPVRIVLDDADGVLGMLRPGLSVVAEVDARSTRNQQ